MAQASLSPGILTWSRTNHGHALPIDTTAKHRIRRDQHLSRAPIKNGQWIITDFKRRDAHALSEFSTDDPTADGKKSDAPARPPLTTLGRTGCLLSRFPLALLSYGTSLLFPRHTPLRRIAGVMRDEQRRIGRQLEAYLRKWIVCGLTAFCAAPQRKRSRTAATPWPKNYARLIRTPRGRSRTSFDRIAINDQALAQLEQARRPGEGQRLVSARHQNRRRYALFLLKLLTRQLAMPLIFVDNTAANDDGARRRRDFGPGYRSARGRG
jgi:hypothetical protein